MNESGSIRLHIAIRDDHGSAGRTYQIHSPVPISCAPVSGIFRECGLFANKASAI